MASPAWTNLISVIEGQQGEGAADKVAEALHAMLQRVAVQVSATQQQPALTPPAPAAPLPWEPLTSAQPPAPSAVPPPATPAMATAASAAAQATAAAVHASEAMGRAETPAAPSVVAIAAQAAAAAAQAAQAAQGAAAAAAAAAATAAAAADAAGTAYANGGSAQSVPSLGMQSPGLSSSGWTPPHGKETWPLTLDRVHGLVTACTPQSLANLGILKPDERQHVQLLVGRLKLLLHPVLAVHQSCDMAAQLPGGVAQLSEDCCILLMQVLAGG